MHTNNTPGTGEVKHIPLPQAVRQEVKERYWQNMKLDSIMFILPKLTVLASPEDKNTHFLSIQPFVCVQDLQISAYLCSIYIHCSQ